MKYRNETLLNRDILVSSEITEDIIIRTQINSLINEIPIDDLKKLFKVKVLNPSEQKPSEDDYAWFGDYLINRLRKEDQILVSTEINIY